MLTQQLRLFVKVDMTKEELIDYIKQLCEIIWDEYPINDPRFQFANEIMTGINGDFGLD